MTEVKADVAALQGDMTEVKADVAALQADVASVQADVTEVKSDIRLILTTLVSQSRTASAPPSEASESENHAILQPPELRKP